MTTEDDFQKALDAHPQDWQTLLVFADWLEERDDPRAEGFRVLGRARRCPTQNHPRPITRVHREVQGWAWYADDAWLEEQCEKFALPLFWRLALSGRQYPETGGVWYSTPFEAFCDAVFVWVHLVPIGRVQWLKDLERRNL